MANPNNRFTRTFNQPAEKVFAAWTQPKLVAAWWGPYGFTNPVCSWNAEVNGSIYVEMTASDGMVFPMKGEFHEVDFPNKIVFTSKAFEDENGNAQLQVLNTVLFIKQNNKTNLVLEAKVVKASDIVQESLDGMQQGWSQSLDKLEDLLK